MATIQPLEQSFCYRLTEYFNELKDGSVTKAAVRMFENCKNWVVRTWKYTVIVIESVGSQISALFIMVMELIYPSFGAKIAMIGLQIRGIWETIKLKFENEDLKDALSRHEKQIKSLEDRNAKLQQQSTTVSKDHTPPSAF
ncbi:MAG: hypothetical protein COT85_07960 [Chlamydiae bacterium CG10_big_fil_rev_8_21_14_0_10_42_34]|nr:MAG: hypothetical protein COT85_07960 [Chlamydiae bacterium CG10_big_fil_rev_8_21_14_0_10_42_34]